MLSRLALGATLYSNRGPDLEMPSDAHTDVPPFVGSPLPIWVPAISDPGMVGPAAGGEGVGRRDSSRAMVLL